MISFASLAFPLFEVFEALGVVVVVGRQMVVKLRDLGVLLAAHLL